MDPGGYVAAVKGSAESLWNEIWFDILNAISEEKQLGLST